MADYGRDQAVFEANRKRNAERERAVSSTSMSDRYMGHGSGGWGQQSWDGAVSPQQVVVKTLKETVEALKTKRAELEANSKDVATSLRVLQQESGASIPEQVFESLRHQIAGHTEAIQVLDAQIADYATAIHLLSTERL